MPGKKCPNCGACKECGAHPPQIVPMPYPVYPPYPRPMYQAPYGAYWSVIPPRPYSGGSIQASGTTPQHLQGLTNSSAIH